VLQPLSCQGGLSIPAPKARRILMVVANGRQVLLGLSEGKRGALAVMVLAAVARGIALNRGSSQAAAAEAALSPSGTPSDSVHRLVPLLQARVRLSACVDAILGLWLWASPSARAPTRFSEHFSRTGCWRRALGCHQPAFGALGEHALARLSVCLGHAQRGRHSAAPDAAFRFAFADWRCGAVGLRGT
jgi:hypothetical protein